MDEQRPPSEPNRRPRRAAVGAIAVLTIALLATGWWGLTQARARRVAELQLTNRYQQQFFEAVGHVENVQVLLSKGLAAGSPRLNVTLLTDLWRQAFAAQASLNQLPISQPTLFRTSRFLTQVGDFGYVLARRSADGQPPSAEDRRKLQELQREATLLSAELHRMATTAARGQVAWLELERRANRDLQRTSRQVADIDFMRVDKQMAEFPTLIYDGPFSDHILQRKPKALTGPTVTAARAQAIARAFWPGNASAVVARTVGRVKQPGIPGYQVELRDRAGRALAMVDVAQQGGHVISMISTRPVDRPTLSLEQAQARAREFLAQRGFPNMQPTWSVQNDGVATIPLAPVQNGVILYPDLVKVTVAMDNGEILGFDALSYRMNHHERRLPKPKISADQAKQMVNPDMLVDGVRLALIPLENLSEVLTWEVRGRLGGEPYLVYINAQTGKEERILKVIKTAEGTRTL